MIRLLLLLVWPLTLLADQTITLGSGISMPPYVIADKDRGIAVDVFRAAMAEENIQVALRYGGNDEVLQAFMNTWMKMDNRLLNMERRLNCK